MANGAYLPYDIELELSSGPEMLTFSTIFSTRSAAPDYRRTTFFEEMKDQQRSRQLPPQILPIARDGGDSMLYLDLWEESWGTVWAYVEGIPGWTGTSASEGIHKVAETLEETISKLRLSEE